MTLAAEPQLPLRYPFPLGETGAVPPLMLWAQKHKPVCPVVLPSGVTGWMLTRKDDVAKALVDPRFSRKISDPGSPRMIGDDLTSVDDAIFNLDPPDHTRVRQVLSGLYTRRAVQQHRPLFARHAARLLDQMAVGPNPVDLIASYTALLPMEAMSELLGVPGDLARECRQAYPMSLDMSAGPEQVAMETERAKQFISHVIAAHREHPVPGTPVHALVQARADEVISETEMFGTIFLIFVTSFDPLVAPLTTGPMILMLHPRQLKECMASPDLWPKAVEEVLRYFHNGGLGFPRVATCDVELHGMLIRRGDPVVVPMQAVTWDPRHYRNPQAFNIHRSTDGSATFGAGPHYCLGSQLARVFLQEAISALFTRFPDLHLAVDERELPWDPSRMFLRPMLLPVTWSLAQAAARSMPAAAMIP
jgi:cytochrome P450